MAQRLHVVSCVQCNIFQVQIVKKSSNKWECKVCKKKQTLLKVFGEGTGPECRKICQALNATRGQLEEQKFIAESKQLEAESQDSYGDEFEQQEDFYTESAEPAKVTPSVSFVPASRSKWAKYSED